MTLPELSQTLAVPLVLTDAQINKSFVNGIDIYEYTGYFQQEFTDASRVRAFPMECDTDGEPITSDTATLLVRQAGTTFTDTITISTSDDSTIIAAIDALIVAP